METKSNDNGLTCPFCGSDSIDQGLFLTYIGGEIRRDVDCRDCGKAWIERFVTEENECPECGSKEIEGLHIIQGEFCLNDTEMGAGLTILDEEQSCYCRECDVDWPAHYSRKA